MPHTIIYTLMAGFMVWIIVVIANDGEVRRNHSSQFITKQDCDNKIKWYDDLAEGKKGPHKSKCVKVPYQRKT